MTDTRIKVINLYKNLQLSKAIRFIWGISPKDTMLSVFFLLLENAGWIGSIYTLKLLINKLVKPSGANDTHITNSILLAGSVAILYVCVKSISVFLTERQAAVINNSVDKQIHEHTISLDYECYEDPVYFDILKRAREAGVDKPYAIVSGLYDMFKNLIMLASMGYILISINWILLPLLTLFVTPVLLVRFKFSKKLYLWQREHTGMEREASYLSSLITAESSAKEVRSFSLGPHLLNKYSNIKKNILEYQLKHNSRRTMVEIGSTAVSTASFFVVIAYIIFGIVNGKTSVGDIAVFLVVFPQSFSTMQGLSASISTIYQNNRYLSDVFALFDLKPTIESSVFTPTTNEKAPNDFTVENLYFKYPHASVNTLENINLTIPAGQIIGLVGLNGAGKSTLIKLLSRLYDPDQGVIRAGTKDIREFNINEYRSKVCVVFQDFVRYNLTAKENIWFGDIYSPMNEERIKNAAEDSGAASYINDFPDQYNTILGRMFDDGHELSGGEWQKLAIARVLYSQSQLIILDEGASALDSIAERELFDNLKQKLGNRSALVISHRLSTIQHANLIYVMKDKTVAEQGTHEALIKKNGVYAKLYTSQ